MSSGWTASWARRRSCGFGTLLEKHDLTTEIFQEVKELLEEKRLLLKPETIVDATIISAPSSTKNREGTRDPEMRQTKKGNQGYCRDEGACGNGSEGLVHSLTVTDAAEADINQLPELMHGEERVLYGDKAYWSEGDRRNTRQRV